MKTLVSAIALVAVSATASMAGDFNLTSWGDRDGKLWSFTKDNGSVWNFYGTGYVNDLKAEISAKKTQLSLSCKLWQSIMLTLSQLFVHKFQT